jgi:hypothetical protein
MLRDIYGKYMGIYGKYRRTYLGYLGFMGNIWEIVYQFTRITNW